MNSRPLVGWVALFAVGCGGSPAATPSRESGQSGLIGQTFAGKDRCNPKEQDRPFVIEWDATDLSSFEARVVHDVVVVRYDGCDLKILDACSNDSVSGQLGAYGAIEWTSGSLEKIDIGSEHELYAKLPLGAASLGGRVRAGEQFHMEYYVSGTRKATRPALYQQTLSSVAGCKGATHFVYAYNVGAFALGSNKAMHGGVGGTVWGIGAGADAKTLNNAEKKSGRLTSCSGETAKEALTCKVPIRLTLREITTGTDAEAAAAKAPETDAALNLAGKVAARLDQNQDAAAHFDAANQKLNAGDGKGCLSELAERDRLDSNPANLSTNPKSSAAGTRALCVMRAGDCTNGRQLARRWAEAATTLSPEQIDTFLSSATGIHCQGSALEPRDQLLKAAADLFKGTTTKTAPGVCARDYATVKRLGPQFEAQAGSDTVLAAAARVPSQAFIAAQCLGLAGDCESAMSAWWEGTRAMNTAETLKPFNDESLRRKTFGTSVPACKAWVESKRTQ